MKQISGAVIRRLPRYYREMQELDRLGVDRISSQELGNRLGFTASQIRQDLNHFGCFGQQGVGYRVSELREELAEILGLAGREYAVVIVGAGNMGRALGSYMPFRKEGYRLLAAFDTNPDVIGKKLADVKILSAEHIEDFVRQNKVDIAILAVPAAAAQSAADALVKGGIRAIWNYAPVDLAVPPEVPVESIHLADSLMTLSYRLQDLT